MNKLRATPISAFFAALLLALFPCSLFALSEFFWEVPEAFSLERGAFPVSAYNEHISVIAWQEAVSTGSGGINEGGSIRISLGVKTLETPWQLYNFIGGPYTYSGLEPAILSIAVDSQDRILIAANASATQAEILISSDLGASFQTYRVSNISENAVAPRIFVRSDGGYILFATRGRDQSLSIYYSLSDDGKAWSEFYSFVTEPGLQLNFLPSHVSLDGMEYTVFQSFVGGVDNVPAFQLYLKTSFDGGRTWTAAQQITTFRDPVMNTAAAADRFDNQRPHLSVQGNSLFLVWERRFGASNPQIYGASLRPDGSLIGIPERINTNSAYCNNPMAFAYQGETTVVWFDNRLGSDRVYLAQRSGLDWRNFQLSGSQGVAFFARPLINGGDLFVFYQLSARGSNWIYVLNPDTTAPAPRLTPMNFLAGQRTRGDRARISWNVPADPSGISGFSYIWTQDPRALPPQELSSPVQTTFAEQIALDDGSWFFVIMARDAAGNWSLPARLEFVRDTTPPPAAAIIMPERDGAGYLVSNDFSLSWNPPPASDIAGYTWSMDYLGPNELYEALGEDDFNRAVSAYSERLPPPIPRLMGTATSVSYANFDNGIWRFSVSAIDEVGNIGPQSSIIYRTNKYIPVTYVTYVDSTQDEQGIVNIRLIGRGFIEEGMISRITLTRDGDDPLDLEFLLSHGDYQILSDREIAGLQISEIASGNYRITLLHPRRGVYNTEPLVQVDEMGTVKFGDYSAAWVPSWAYKSQRRLVVDTTLVILFGVMLFCIAGFILSIRGIGSTIADGNAIRVEAAALITGDIMPSEKKRRIESIKRRGAGLRLKLASFTIALVIVVVLLVSIPLYINMTRTQRETLLRGLWDRSSVLLEGLASSARAYLPSSNTLELGFLPAQISAIPEAQYVTITGFGSESATIFGDLVWATNDPAIRDKIDTNDFQPGVSRLEDVLSPRLDEIAQELNEQAQEAVGDLSASIASLTQEALSLALRTDQASRQRLNDIQVSIRSFETRLTEVLTALGQEIGSEPAFSRTEIADSGDHTYIFFKPVMYRQGAEDIYFRGLIRLEVSVESIVEEIVQGQRTLLIVISLVALFALGIGTVGALVLSTLIIQPIRRLVSHVELIRDTEDKSKLEGVDIAISSRDELAVLGTTINDMTHGLVRAAQAASDLTIGKEVQKKFIPLELDRDGNKLTSGFKDTQNVQFFGYYEGAKGVSGDYFDYQDLDGRYFAIIKCDVAGKGIPAALIMIQVATMFLNYFKAWKPTAKGMHIEEVVYQINDFIEALDFKGRFASFTLALFDSQTGLIRFCNAGDNIVHWYDASEGAMRMVTLPETPATGVLPNYLVETKGGYTVQSLNIDHGDILFLYTDGIEEAKRKFRDRAFKEILCAEKGAPQDTPHENHSVGQGDEELGQDRVTDIINAAMNKRSYKLKKYHNPEGEQELEFDFSSCQGEVDDAIMAMVSVEKMFRLYKEPGTSEESQVLVDKKVDEFLKSHFLQYRNYCSETKEYSENETYMYYTHVNEDPQYDDLTILGIKRK